MKDRWTTLTGWLDRVDALLGEHDRVVAEANRHLSPEMRDVVRSSKGKRPSD